MEIYFASAMLEHKMMLFGETVKDSRWRARQVSKRPDSNLWRNCARDAWTRWDRSSIQILEPIPGCAVVILDKIKYVRHLANLVPPRKPCAMLLVGSMGSAKAPH
eukprot:8423727-Pyramimonas_sp.AAC.1